MVVYFVGCDVVVCEVVDLCFDCYGVVYFDVVFCVVFVCCVDIDELFFEVVVFFVVYVVEVDGGLIDDVCYVVVVVVDCYVLVF